MTTTHTHTNTRITPKIAIEEWGLYNAGVLACKWWDLETTDYEDIVKYYRALRADYGIFPTDDLELFPADWEGDYLGIITENSNIEELLETYQKVADLGEDERIAVSYLMDDLGYSIDDALSHYNDVIMYYDIHDYSDLAYDMVEEGILGDIPDNIQPYIDYEKLGNDLRIEGWTLKDGYALYYA